MHCSSMTAPGASALSSNRGFHGESRVRIGNGQRSLVGVLNLPAGFKNPPVVLLLHGFTGQKDEFPIAAIDAGLFAHTAKRLAQDGIGSLRIDFHGSGESNDCWEETTLTGQIRDAAVAFDYLRALASVNGSKVGILGYSQGGLIGAHLAAMRPESSVVVLWSPITDPLPTYGIIMGRETVENALLESDDRVVGAKLCWGGETKLKCAFFKELPRLSPIPAIGKYTGPLRVIVGLRETIVTPQPAAGQSLLDCHNGIHDLVEIDSDHDWNASTTIKTIDDLLIPKTVDWFKSHF
ncbi:alpha/beta superfamily hydrolase [Phyllobacterium sp. 1468]|nr:alpha/beta superfamily hydrolase [Phyllobacterium sp. 1468]